ncbi:MAG: nickel-dependent lactate racemase [Desulfobacterales bacterium]|jgi:nickel-dependent lactate racemase
MDITLKYGDGQKAIQIPEKGDVAVLEPSSLPPVSSIEEALGDALRSPVEGPPLAEIVRRRQPGSVVIAVPDETRPAPVKEMLPILLKELMSEGGGLTPSDITILIGGGLHPPLDSKALTRLIPPEVAGGCRVRAHDAVHGELVDVGRTSRGTPVRINKLFARGDVGIVIGQIDPHQFVGFTGGSKGVVIGCGGAETIEHNHSLMFDEKAQVGRLRDNPVREDLNEAGEMVGIDLTINCVLNPQKQVVRMVSGPHLPVLETGAATCASIYGVAIDQKFDIVVASCGGYPKDICLYQAQKGLNLASQAVRKGGHILLLAASPQGVGDDIYFDYVSQFTTPEEVLHDFRKIGFKMGAHKAYLFGRTLTQYDVAVFSDLDQGILRKCHLRAADPSGIVTEWVDAFKGRPRVGVIPNANTTYFYESTRLSPSQHH